MTIRTARLLITELTEDMAQIMHENSLDEDNRRFVPDEVWETADEAQETIQYLMEQYGNADGPLVYAILTHEGLNVGYVQLAPIEEGWELGYHIAKAHTGKGYASEAAMSFLPVIANELRLDTVYGICLADNTASIRVLEKCGFKTVFNGIGMYQGEERKLIKAVWNAPASL